MATNFPTSLDALTNPTSSDSLSSPSHSAQHANVNDAVEALQAKVGADSSAVTSSLDYKVAQLEAISHGKILQVVSTTKTDTFTTTSSSFTALTGLSVSITPSSTTSKILVLANLKGASEQNVSGSVLHYRLMRDSTAISIGDAEGSATRASGQLTTRLTGASGIMFADTAVFLDDPSTTSSVVYSVQVRTKNGALFINRPQDSATTDDGYARTASSITVMEVSA